MVVFSIVPAPAWNQAGASFKVQQKFSKAKSTSTAFGQSGNGAPPYCTEHIMIRHQRVSAVRDPTASHWPESLYRGVRGNIAWRGPQISYLAPIHYTRNPPSMKYTVVPRVRGAEQYTQQQFTLTHLHHECGILSEQRPDRRGTVASPTSREFLITRIS